MVVINNDNGSNVLVTSEKVEEPVATVSNSAPGSYSSGAKKPPGINDASKKHKTPKVCARILSNNICYKLL